MSSATLNLAVNRPLAHHQRRNAIPRAVEGEVRVLARTFAAGIRRDHR